MEKIGIFYGSTTGHTQEIAEILAQKFDNSELIDVSKANREDLLKFKNLILASSTYGDGELQDDWDDFADSLEEDDFVGKNVAIVGLGDQDSYSDSFCDCIGLLAHLARKANLIGKTKNENYDFQETISLSEGEFMGLALDVDNQSDLTQSRLEAWIADIKDKFE